MRTNKVTLGVAVTLALVMSAATFGRGTQVSSQQASQPQGTQNATPTPGQAPDKTQPGADKAQAQLSVQDTNNAFVARIKEQIKGREKEPAQKVFKNVKWLTDTPAATFLVIMNIGYSRALGVTCTHCHVETDFSSDEKREKRAAREMQALHRSINDQLSKMQNLRPKPDHFINCTTCHRGSTDPIKSSS
jgi:hypothetical protein